MKRQTARIEPSGIAHALDVHVQMLDFKGVFYAQKSSNLSSTLCFCGLPEVREKLLTKLSTGAVDCR